MNAMVRFALEFDKVNPAGTDAELRNQLQMKNDKMDCVNFIGVGDFQSQA